MALKVKKTNEPSCPGINWKARTPMSEADYASVRNCDVGSAAEQEKRFKAFCDAHWDLNNNDGGCSGCPINKIRAGS